MTIADSLNAVYTICDKMWNLYLQVMIPGLGISAGAWLLAGVIISFCLGFIRYEFGIGKDADYRSGQSRSARIPKERMLDEK